MVSRDHGKKRHHLSQINTPECMSADRLLGGSATPLKLARWAPTAQTVEVIDEALNLPGARTRNGHRVHVGQSDEGSEAPTLGKCPIRRSGGRISRAIRSGLESTEAAPPIAAILAGRTGFLACRRSQGAYVPVGTLRRAVTYPLPAEDKNVDEITRALKRPFH